MGAFSWWVFGDVNDVGVAAFSVAVDDERKVSLFCLGHEEGRVVACVDYRWGVT